MKKPDLDDIALAIITACWSIFALASAALLISGLLFGFDKFDTGLFK